MNFDFSPANSSTNTTRNLSNAAALMDISNTLNITSADSTMTGTEAKKMAALARFKAMEADITPRTAINQFVEANQSEAQTPALFFSTGEITESRRSSKRRRVGDKTSVSVVSMEETNLNEDIAGNLSSDTSDTTETSRTLRRSARGRGKTSLGVTMEDVDPDRDITKPTNMSATVNMTDMHLTDDSLDETMHNLRNKKRGREKKTYFTADDFNITVATKANKSQAVTDVPVNNTLQLDKSDNESMILQEKMSKRRKMLERKKARHQAASNWDFSGIEPPSPQQKSEDVISQLAPEKMKSLSETTAEKRSDNEESALEFSSFEETHVSKRKSTIKTIHITEGEFSDITTTSNKDISKAHETTTLPIDSDMNSPDDDNSSTSTLNANSNGGLTQDRNTDDDVDDIDREVSFTRKDGIQNVENVAKNDGSDLDALQSTQEGTPIKSSSRRKKIAIGTVDFEDITTTNDQEAVGSTHASPVNSLFPPITNTPSPGSRKLTNMQKSAHSNTESEETIENISRFVNNESSNIKNRRKSVFQSGLPQGPDDNTMVLEQTRVFRPEVESTRLTNLSEISRTINNTVTSALGVASPEVTDTAAKPGRDTSTPYDFNKSTREGLRGRGLSKTAAVLATIPSEDRAEERASKTVTDVIDPQLPTPQIMEVIRDARKSGMRSMRLSVYDKTRDHPEDGKDGGTQTSPEVFLLPEEIPVNHEAGCQVTPSLDAENHRPKVLGDVSLPVGHTTISQQQLSSRNATFNGFSVSNEESRERADKRRSEVNEIINSLTNLSGAREQSDNLMNSLTEEVNIDLKENEGDLENIEAELDITASGRRNPSPVIERRSEVDINASAVSVAENGNEVEDEEDVQINRTEARVINDLGEDEIEQADEYDQDDEGNGDRDQSLDYLRLPDASQVKSIPSSQERKEMRQATLSKYLGVNDATSLSPLTTPQVSPKKTKEQMPKAKPTKRLKAKDTSLIPAKNIKFEYQRFSRYKVKPDAEKTLVSASNEFLNRAMKRMSVFAAERGAVKIHMCDIKRMMVECGFVKPAEEDPTGREFTCELREIARDSQIKELIPMNKGLGNIYPPRDLWDIKGGKKSKNVAPVPSASSVGGGKKVKADKVRRFKVSCDEY